VIINDQSFMLTKHETEIKLLGWKWFADQTKLTVMIIYGKN